MGELYQEQAGSPITSRAHSIKHTQPQQVLWVATVIDSPDSSDFATNFDFLQALSTKLH